MSEQAQKNMPLFIMAGILLIYGAIVSTGVLLPVMKYLNTHKSMDFQVVMCLTMGIVGLAGGIINSIRTPKDSTLDRFILQPLAGVILLLVLAMAIRWYLEPLVKIMSKNLVPLLGFKVYKVLNLNYVVLGILVGGLNHEYGRDSLLCRIRN